MFTGIVTAIGTIESAEQRGDLRLRIACPFDPADISIGASIACSGVCLTAVDKGGTKGDAHFTVDLSAETVSRTAKGMWDEGAELNLEPSLRIGDELGGHIVTGHVDAVGTVVDWQPSGDSWIAVIAAPAALAPFIAEKGSITVNGVSLTVNSVEDQLDGTAHFTLNIIPHTGEVTTLGDLKKGSEVNLEVDTIARYLHRMQALKS
ncbi:riboflavin synthase [Aurantiacibacter sediminis]|uniref:Riboflavin synthase n=1 Tax=Aurantiacibacter sediminis TaxID=2793064 RepID=A0ABS0N1K0_9SPHN|nr:riboflavin synthase [Aurantiacibacter sediminis]MBH5321798.1 riboflavin synthase [Aurantiacibacter sediminis]